MLRHVDPPTVVRRHVVDRVALLSRTVLGRALRRRARSAPPARAKAAQAWDAAEGRGHSQGRVGMGVGPAGRAAGPGG